MPDKSNKQPNKIKSFIGKEKKLQYHLYSSTFEFEKKGEKTRKKKFK